MTHKSDRIGRMVEELKGQALEARYLGYFECFNRGEFYEAHEVLEDLWLMERRGPEGDFYKGLIQLAAAFVHLQKGRISPSIALLNRARNHLQHYPTIHHHLDLAQVVDLTRDWEARLKQAAARPPASRWSYPKLALSTRA